MSASEHAVFESGAILQYLGDKYPTPMYPSDSIARSTITQWLMWQVGTAPYLGGGGFGHFTKYAPQKIEYAIERTTKEAKRILTVLDSQLARTNAFVAGDEFTIADVALFPWMLTMKLNYNADELLDMDKLGNLVAWMKRCEERPGVQRGLKVLSFVNDNKHHESEGTK